MICTITIPKLSFTHSPPTPAVRFDFPISSAPLIPVSHPPSSSVTFSHSARSPTLSVSHTGESTGVCVSSSQHTRLPFSMRQVSGGSTRVTTAAQVSETVGERGVCETAGVCEPPIHGVTRVSGSK